MKTSSLLILLGTLCSSSLAAATFSHSPAGTIKGARLAYASSSSITIGVGYGDIGGSYWEIAPGDPLLTTGYSLTALSATTNGEVDYIYINGTSSPLPTVIIYDSTTAPSWSDGNMGWYNGADRCIGALYINPAGTLAQFSCTEDSVFMIASGVNVVTSGSTTTTFNWGSGYWNTASASAVLPVNSCAARWYCTVQGGGTAWCRLRIAPIELDIASIVEATGGGANGGYAITDEWMNLPRSFSNTFVWVAQIASSTVNSTPVTFGILGYKIER